MKGIFDNSIDNKVNNDADADKKLQSNAAKTAAQPSHHEYAAAINQLQPSIAWENDLIYWANILKHSKRVSANGAAAFCAKDELRKR